MRISVENLTKRFEPLAVVNEVNLAIEEGELFTLLGPSGCGKTTLLRLVAGFYAADGGEIRFDDRVVNAVPPHERGIGMVFQNHALWPHMTVAENVSYGLKLRKISSSRITARFQEVLENVKLGGLGDRYPAQLSGGQQQRVALARARRASGARTFQLAAISPKSRAISASASIQSSSSEPGAKPRRSAMK